MWSAASPSLGMTPLRFSRFDFRSPAYCVRFPSQISNLQFQILRLLCYSSPPACRVLLSRCSVSICNLIPDACLPRAQRRSTRSLFRHFLFSLVLSSASASICVHLRFRESAGCRSPGIPEESAELHRSPNTGLRFHRVFPDTGYPIPDTCLFQPFNVHSVHCPPHFSARHEEILLELAKSHVSS